MKNVLLADDHSIFREGLKSLLETSGGYRVVAQAGNGRDAVQMAALHSPDFVIMDVCMPELNGLEATRQIRKALPNCRILMLSMNAERQFVVQAFQAGAMAYLLKDNAVEELLRALEAVLKGLQYVSPQVTGILVDVLNRPLPETQTVELSEREREVLQLIAEGVSTRQSATKLGVSIKTIETHRMRIMQKTGIDSVAGLTKFAIRHGYTTL